MPICGNCARERDFFVMDIADGVEDGRLGLRLVTAVVTLEERFTGSMWARLIGLWVELAAGSSLDSVTFVQTASCHQESPGQ